MLSWPLNPSFFAQPFWMQGCWVLFIFLHIQGSAYLSMETLERGLLTPKSNVWSFGIVLLELLTGRRNLDSRYPKEERNLVKWSRPFLTDDGRLSLIMDPQLKGRFPTKAARTVADIAQKCLQKDPSERPTMRNVVEHLKIIQNLKQSSRFPLQEPIAASPSKQMLRSPSLDGIITPAAARLSFSPSPPSGVHPSLSPGGKTSSPTLPPRLCSTLSFEDFDRQERRKSSASSLRRPRIEGYWYSKFILFVYYLLNFSSLFFSVVFWWLIQHNVQQMEERKKNP